MNIKQDDGTTITVDAPKGARKFVRRVGPPGEWGRLGHVRGFVDGNVVFRWWSPKRGWMYVVEPLWLMRMKSPLWAWGKGINDGGDS